DTKAEHTPARRAARRRVVDALKHGKPLGVRLAMDIKLEPAVVTEGSADLLDAAICAVQAAWAATRVNYGLPADAPAGEGWIVSSQAAARNPWRACKSAGG